jgi:hypothetical protein
MAKTRYARNISKRKGATKRRDNTKRRVIKKKGLSMTRRRGGSTLYRRLRRLKRGAMRVGNFGSKGAKNAASGIGNVATYTKDKASAAANYAADKASAAANYAKISAQNRIAAVNAAASEASCVGIDDELDDARRSLEKATDKVRRLEVTQYRCNPPELENIDVD